MNWEHLEDFFEVNTIGLQINHNFEEKHLLEGNGHEK